MVATSYRKTDMSVLVVQFFVYGLLFLQLAPVTEAGKLSKICNKLNCFSKSDDGPTQNFPKPPSSGITCSNPKAPKDATGWNVYKHAKPMPSVADIVADIKLCGLLTATTPTVFYSFNGGYSNAKRFIKENPNLNGKTINDVLPDSWYTALGQVPGLNSASGMARTAWIARTSQALATASSGDAYLVADPSANIYTIPYADTKENAWKGAHNVWFDYEFATLQRNSAVKGIYTVNSNSLAIDKGPTGSWVRGRTPQGDTAGNHVDANKVTAATLQKQKDDYEKQQACSGAGSAGRKRGANASSAAACGIRSKTASRTVPTTLVTKTSTPKASTPTPKSPVGVGSKTPKVSPKATKTSAKTTPTKPSCPKGKKC